MVHLWSMEGGQSYCRESMTQRLWVSFKATTSLGVMRHTVPPAEILHSNFLMFLIGTFLDAFVLTKLRKTMELFLRSFQSLLSFQPLVSALFTLSFHRSPSKTMLCECNVNGPLFLCFQILLQSVSERFSVLLLSKRHRHPSSIE